MRSGIGNSASDPFFVSSGTPGGASSPAGTAADPVNTQSPVLPTGLNRSGTATNTSAVKISANASRRFLNIQNVSTTDTLGVNEFGAAATIGSASTYTVPPGAFLSVRTNQAVSIVSSATGPTPFTATEG